VTACYISEIVQASGKVYTEREYEVIAYESYRMVSFPVTMTYLHSLLWNCTRIKVTMGMLFTLIYLQQFVV